MKKSKSSPAKLIGRISTIEFQIVKAIDIRFNKSTFKVGKNCPTIKPITGIVKINMKCMNVIKSYSQRTGLCDVGGFEKRQARNQSPIEKLMTKITTKS